MIKKCKPLHYILYQPAFNMSIDCIKFFKFKKPGPVPARAWECSYRFICIYFFKRSAITLAIYIPFAAD